MRKINYWNDKTIVKEIKALASNIDFMPTVMFLRAIGRNDLSCAISRHGGWKKFSKLSGLDMKQSDTLTGWKGEEEAQELLESKGFHCQKMSTGQAYDLRVDDFVRIDVKSAKFCEYGASKGWFYRIGKEPTCDIIMLYRMDLKDCFIIPWFACGKTNITISKSMKAHKKYYQDFDMVTYFRDAITDILDK